MPKYLWLCLIAAVRTRRKNFGVHGWRELMELSTKSTDLATISLSRHREGNGIPSESSYKLFPFSFFPLQLASLRIVERRVSAIKAISDMEIEQLLTEVRLLRSYFNEEQLQVPVSEFFEKNLPNVLVVKDSVNGHMSLLRHMSVAYPEFSGVEPSYSGFQFSDQAGMTSCHDAKRLSTGTVILGDPCGSQTLGMQNGLQTPGVNTPSLSYIGMTPKTQRQPKQGELLLSVHGSPLGVFKEDNNMEAIRESDEG